MKHDIRLYISILSDEVNMLNCNTKYGYRFAVDDASKILKYISQYDDFDVYSVWIYLGKLFIYSIKDAEAQGVSLDVMYAHLLELAQTGNTEFSTLEAQIELEAFMTDCLFKERVQIVQLFDCFKALGVSLTELRQFSLAALAVNTTVKEQQFLKDTLLSALIKAEEETELSNTKRFYECLQDHITNENIKRYYDHYQLY